MTYPVNELPHILDDFGPRPDSADPRFRPAARGGAELEGARGSRQQYRGLEL